MIILIPPSEGKLESGSQKPVKTLSPEQEEIYQRILDYPGDLGKLYGVKGDALKGAIETNKKVKNAQTCMAIERYSGVVYAGIEYHTLKADAKIRAREQIHIVSALFGLIRADTLIPNYKLKIEKIDAYKLWKPIIGRELKKDFVVDLLPQAHRKAVYYKNGVRVEFIFRKNGEKKPAGHAGKLIKGKFVRWLLQNNIQDVDKMLAFNLEGFEGERVNNQLIEFTKCL